MTALEFLADGLCGQTDPEAFHPEKGTPAGPAKRICQGCPVQQQCLEYALAQDERFGVWGGMSAAERARLRRQRQLPGRVEQHRAHARNTARRMHARGASKATIARALRVSGSTLNDYLDDQQQGGGDQR